MARQEEKPRKRIVPQLIVASPTKLPDAYDGLPPPSPQLQVTDLREQAEFAKEHLGLDRKIYVDLRPYQESNKAVNWKQLLKERGAKPAGKVPRGGSGEEPGAEDLMSRGHNPRQASNPLLRVLRRLDHTYCIRNESDEDSDDSQEEEEDSSGSDMDDEGGSGGNATDGGARTDAEAGPDSLPLPKKKKKADKAPAGGDDYDHGDDWIDDEEFFDMIECSDKRKTKFEGFFITRGEIERTEEMLPGFSPEKARKPAAAPKRKPAEGGGFDSGSDFQNAPPKPRAAKEGGEGGEKKAAKRKAEGEGEEPAKKKKKKLVPGAIPGAAPAPGPAQAAGDPAVQAPKKQTFAQLAASCGALASAGVLREGTSVSPDHRLHAHAAALPPTPADRPAGSMPPPPPSAKRANSEPYELRPDVAAAISRLRQVAEVAQGQLPPEPPTSADGEEAAPKRKKNIPPAVRAALDSFSGIYCRETNGNSSASRLLLGELDSFMAPFCTPKTLCSLLRKTAAKGDKPPSGMTLDGLKALLAGTAPPPPPKQSAAAVPGNSDDDFEQPPTQALAPEQQQAADGSAAAPSASAAAAGAAAGKDGKAVVAYTHVPPGMRREVYQYMHAELKEKALNTHEGKLTIQAVLNAFPAGVIAVDGIKKIYTLGKLQATKAAAKAAALTGQAQPATSQQLAQPKKAGSRQPSRAPSPALTSTSPEAKQYAQAAALAAQAKLAPTPAREAAAVQPAVPADQPVAGAAAPAVHPMVSGATADGNAAAVAGDVASEALVPRMSDEEVVQAGVQHGAAAEALREVLASLKSSKGQYAPVLARVLMLTGPGGAHAAEIMAKASELRFAAGWEGKNTQVARVISNMDCVARLGKGLYALRAFPGVVHVPTDKPAKAASASSEEAAGGSMGAAQAPGQAPAAEPPVAVLAAAQEGPAHEEGSA